MAKDSVTMSLPPIKERLPGPVRGVAGYSARFRHFLHQVRLELNHVTWPTWPDVRATTVVVIVAVFLLGFYLGFVLDVPLARLMKWLLQHGKRWLG